MARSGKCRVIVKDGVVSMPEPPPAPDSSGLRIEVGKESVFAKLRREVLDDLDAIDRVKKLFARKDVERQPRNERQPREKQTVLPVEDYSDVDPRTVNISDPGAVIKWNLENIAMQDRPRKILGALWLEDVDIARTAEMLRVPVGLVEKIWFRALGELRFARRMREHEKLKRCPNNMPKRITLLRLAHSSVWFPEPIWYTEGAD